MEHQYVLWNNKIHCFIIPVYNIPRKYNFTIQVPYAVEWNPYKLHNRSYGREISYGLVVLSRDLNGG